jgi:hypothetical protein
MVKKNLKTPYRVSLLKHLAPGVPLSPEPFITALLCFGGVTRP